MSHHVLIVEDDLAIARLAIILAKAPSQVDKRMAEDVLIEGDLAPLPESRGSESRGRKNH